MAITPFKVIQGHRLWYQPKAHMRLSISDCTVSKLWPIIGLIFASYRGVPHFNVLARGDPLRSSE